MQEITKTENRTPKIEKITWLLFALVIVAVYFFALDLPLLGPDEPRYAQVAREMFQRNDWVTPTLGGANWFEKPALLYWLQIVSYKLFGVSEFAARFGSALFGLGTICSLWILGKSVHSSQFTVHSSTEKPKTLNDFANWLALITASSIGLIVFSRGASFDIILTLPMTASLVCFFIYDLKTSASSASFAVKYLLGFYFFIGVALLAKGLIGIVFPFAIVAFYFLLSQKLPNKTLIFSLFWGTILSVIVASSWYAPMYQTHGWRFVDEFFVQHHFQRYTSNKYQHPQPFPFFFWVLPLMTLPWLPFFLAAIWNIFKNFLKRGNAETQNDKKHTAHRSSLVTFAFAWLLVPLVFFSFSGSKLPGYILPALPAALVLTAEYVYKFARQSARRKLFLQIAAFSVFAAAAFSLRFAAPYYFFQDSVKGLVEAADASGYQSEKIVNLYTVSHNLEFYAPERLVRNSDGTQKRYDDFSILAADVKSSANGKILVLIPHKDVANILSENSSVETKVLDSNEEQSIVLLKTK